jgi:protein kinase-like protein
VRVGNAISEGGGQTTRLGSFEIVRKLARGGMAEIFLARTRGPSGFEKLVVLKKVLPQYAGKQRFVQLFLEEAKLAASLDHPNIAQVYDIGMVDGSYFFTMEYLHGQDVRSILQRTWRTGEKFPIEHAVQIARHVASALHFAHEKPRSDGALLGIIHRDVSPSNVIVTYDGATKLLDFGVAKTSVSTVKTRTGVLKGKIAYMSPEQARGAPLDRRSDIFSLGIMLWEMVTTQRLYRADNDLATLQMIINQPAKPPTSVRPDCPPELERIVMRALAEDPAARYATAEQLVTDLDELAREHKLKQSSNALATMMGQLFAVELTAWREARAAGVPLADHLHDAVAMTTPVSESDFVEIEALLEEDEDGEDGDGGDGKDGGNGGDGGQDDDLDDLEKTQHAAPFLDPLPPLTMEPALGPEARTPPRGTPRPIRHVTSSAPTASFRPVTGEHAAPTASFRPVTGEQAAPSAPAASFRPVTGEHAALSASPGPTAGWHAEPGAALATPASPPFAAVSSHVGPVAPVPSVYATPSAPFVAVGSHPSATGVPLAAMTSPRTTASIPFAVPPWQSGLPAAPPSEERLARSWAVIELPAFDPEVFERRRRLVFRIAGGVLGIIFGLAILTGHC